jgi:hypothetical protein
MILGRGPRVIERDRFRQVEPRDLKTAQVFPRWNLRLTRGELATPKRHECSTAGKPVTNSPMVVAVRPILAAILLRPVVMGPRSRRVQDQICSQFCSRKILFAVWVVAAEQYAEKRLNK